MSNKNSCFEDNLGIFIIDKNRSKKTKNIFKKAVDISFFQCYSNKAVANKEQKSTAKNLDK